MHRSMIGVAAFAVAAATVTASAERIAIQRYEGFNSPNGNDNPQAYGLRLDNLLGAGTGATTFSFENPTEPTPRLGTSSVDIVLFQDSVNPGTYYLQITGSIFGNTTNGGGSPQSAPGSIGQYDINLTYTGTWVNGLFESTAEENIGELRRTVAGSGPSSPEVIVLKSKSRGDYSFRFGFDIGDEDRNSANEYIEAAGWVMGWTQNFDGSNRRQIANGTHDLLFTADQTAASIIPLPHPAAMAGFSLAGLAMARRRRG